MPCTLVNVDDVVADIIDAIFVDLDVGDIDVIFVDDASINSAV